MSPNTSQSDKAFKSYIKKEEDEDEDEDEEDDDDDRFFLVFSYYGCRGRQAAFALRCCANRPGAPAPAMIWSKISRNT